MSPLPPPQPICHSIWPPPGGRTGGHKQLGVSASGSFSNVLGQTFLKGAKRFTGLPDYKNGKRSINWINLAFFWPPIKVWKQNQKKSTHKWGKTKDRSTRSTPTPKKTNLPSTKSRQKEQTKRSSASRKRSNASTKDQRRIKKIKLTGKKGSTISKKIKPKLQRQHKTN